MRVEIILKDDAGEVLDYQEGPVKQPLQMRTHPEKPMIDGKYNFFGWTWQPIITITLGRQVQP